MTCQLTERQKKANDTLGSDATHIMLFGGSRSGKTFLNVRALVTRSLAHKSRHAILRYRFNHLKASIVYDTLPKVMDLCFPGVADHCHLDKSDWFYTLPNKSEIWFGGLDDKERTEKILGQEYATIFMNECSQIPWASRNIAITRLAQNTPLRLKAYYDCVAGDTILPGQTQTIAELAYIGQPIMALTTHGWRKASAPWRNGVGRLYEIETSGGRRLRVTASHRVWTQQGWSRIDQITIGQLILCTDEHRFPRDDPSDRDEKQKPQDSPESYCKYRHLSDEQFRQEPVAGQADPAFASDEVGHSQNLCRHGVLGCHKGHQPPHEAQHSRHNQACRAPLYPRFCESFLHKVLIGAAPACEWFQQKYQFARQSILRVGRRTTVLVSRFVAQPSFASFECSPAGLDLVSIDKQSQRYSQAERLCPDQTGLLPIDPCIDLSSRDTPLFDKCDFESVVGIEYSATDSFYTIEVPFVNHYIANGIVSHNCNPPSMAHWTYRVFHEKRDPDSKQSLRDPNNFASLLMNPQDNAANLSPQYLKELDAMPERVRRRFLLGQFSDVSESALWSLELLDQQRLIDKPLPDMARVIIAVDPSGCSGEEDKRSDEIGIVVAGLGVDGKGYVLEDLSARLGPAQWAKAVTAAFERHQADCVVAEVNYGGAMVKELIRSARPGTPFREVTASRGKVVRAEPISALFEQQKIWIVGYMAELEDQLCAMTTYGYTGNRSPDRADAMVWAFTELFPGLTRRAEAISTQRPKVVMGHQPARRR